MLLTGGELDSPLGGRAGASSDAPSPPSCSLRYPIRLRVCIRLRVKYPICVRVRVAISQVSLSVKYPICARVRVPSAEASGSHLRRLQLSHLHLRPGVMPQKQTRQQKRTNCPSPRSPSPAVCPSPRHSPLLAASAFSCASGSPAATVSIRVANHG